MKTEKEAKELQESLELAMRLRNMKKDDRNVIDSGKLLSAFVANLDIMIANAPEGDEPGGVKPIEMSFVKSAWGWPSRYIKEIDLVGEHWHADFLKAKKVVMNGGLLALIGGRGNGKTRMATEIARAGFWPTDKGEWNGNRTVVGKTALYRRAVDIFLDLRAANTKGSTTSDRDVLGRLEKAALLVIDEFQERGETEWENRILTNLLDKRYGDAKPTIIIANFQDDQLEAALGVSVGERMAETGGVIRFEGPSLR